MRSVFRGALNGLHALYNVLSCTLLPKKSIEINVLYNQRIGKSLFIQIYFKCCIKNTVRFIELRVTFRKLGVEMGGKTETKYLTIGGQVEE